MVIFYFSGTGNSKYIAELFALKMGAEAYSIEEAVDFSQIIGCHERIAFCYPIYGSCVPRLMRVFVDDYQELLQSHKLLVFCTQLLFSGDGARKLFEGYSKCQNQVIYAEHFSMPNNLCNAGIFKVRNGEATHKYMIRARTKVMRIKKDLEAGIHKKRGYHWISQVLGLSQSAFWPGIEERMKGSASCDKDCTQCGICVSLCPVGNLTLTMDGIVQSNRCMFCYRCVNACPNRAITVLIKKKPKVQYRGPGHF